MKQVLLICLVLTGVLCDSHRIGAKWSKLRLDDAEGMFRSLEDTTTSKVASSTKTVSKETGGTSNAASSEASGNDDDSVEDVDDDATGTESGSAKKDETSSPKTSKASSNDDDSVNEDDDSTSGTVSSPTDTAESPDTSGGETDSDTKKSSGGGSSSSSISDDDEIDAYSNSTIPFMPPDEVEPPFWKECVMGVFLLIAIVLCGMTARKSCCKKSDYDSIPSTTLVV
mmetsp:Transcript_19445/g.29228  ORF Transcript_19445/g.29228 Transcript_19445/m.29228 type:complete len:227 (+) Transcript_19445:129-809(+)